MMANINGKYSSLKYDSSVVILMETDMSVPKTY